MKAAGLFFLRTNAYTARTSAGARSVLLPLVEREVHGTHGMPAVHQHLTAIWVGEDAERFLDSNQPQLKPGCPLQVELQSLRAINNEIHGNVVTCTLAPSRWERRQQPDDVAASTQPQPQANTQ